MENIFLTFTKEMTHEWFLRFAHDLAKFNPGRVLEIVGTGLRLEAVKGSDRIKYMFSGTFGTLLEVSRNEWLAELYAFENEVKGVAECKTQYHHYQN